MYKKASDFFFSLNYVCHWNLTIFNIYSKSFKFLKFPSKPSLYFVSSEYYASPILLFLFFFWTNCIGSAHPKPSKEIMVVTCEQNSVSWSFPRTHPSRETCCPLSSGCFLFPTPTSASHAFPGCGIHSVRSLGTLGRSERPQMLPLLGVGVLGKHQRVSAFLRAIRAKGHILLKRSTPPASPRYVGGSPSNCQQLRGAGTPFSLPPAMAGWRGSKGLWGAG